MQLLYWLIGAWQLNTYVIVVLLCVTAVSEFSFELLALIQGWSKVLLQVLPHISLLSEAFVSKRAFKGPDAFMGPRVVEHIPGTVEFFVTAIDFSLVNDGERTILLVLYLLSLVFEFLQQLKIDIVFRQFLEIFDAVGKRCIFCRAQYTTKTVFLSHIFYGSHTFRGWKRDIRSHLERYSHNKSRSKMNSQFQKPPNRRYLLTLSLNCL